MTAKALEPGYFDALYAQSADPWRFATSPYEAAKYADTVASLPRERYHSAVEIGCSVGVLTAALAPRCDALLGLDIADAALASATKRCRALPHVSFVRSTLPDVPPAGRFDLIMLSEVLYYWTPEALVRMAAAVVEIADDDADIVLVHWLGPTPDYPLDGDEAVTIFERALGGSVMLRKRTADYRLDVLRVARASRPAA